MRKYKILWADDEIELLKPHILFLHARGCEVDPVLSGNDALDKINERAYDLVFLDENMPGLTGLETLTKIKSMLPNQPVVMITKSEEENIMEEAIGAKIADYLIKPLNPNQILLSIKKILDNKRLVAEHTNQSYQQDFHNISMAVNEDLDFNEWIDLYSKMVYWELEIDKTAERDMAEVLSMQKDEANSEFTRYIMDNYESWLNDPNVPKPLLSHQVMRKEVFPKLSEGRPVFFFVIDNLRLDQWELLEPTLAGYFTIARKNPAFAILPTTTAYGRNAIFSGMLPSDMARHHPDLWVNETEGDAKNNFESEFLDRQLKRNKLDIKYAYHKILRKDQGRQLLSSVNNMMNNDLNAIVYNFIDVMSHARTDAKVIRELAADESAYRSLTSSWFKHSTLLEILKMLSERDVHVIITTDHGTVRVRKPIKITGDKDTNKNLRFKFGKSLTLKKGEQVYVCKNPADLFLPRLDVSSTYVFAGGSDFFIYPSSFSYRANYYKDTFQHGGISLEEMILPVVHLQPKNK